MRPPLRLFAASALLLFAAACGPSAAPKHGTSAHGGLQHGAAGRIIPVDDRTLAAGGSDTVRFGHLHEGETAVLRLRLRNDTRRPLLVLGHERSCGCTLLEYENRPIPPDSTLPLTLRFDARGTYGWQLKLVTIRFSGAAEPLRLLVEADVD